MPENNHNELINIERSVIACLIRENVLLNTVDLAGNDFVNSTNREIYQSALSMAAARIPVDVITLSDYMEKQTREQWLAVIGDLVRNTIATVGNFKTYVAAVKQHSQERKIREIANKLGQDLDSDSAIRSLLDLMRTKRCYEYTGIQAVVKAVESIEKAAESGNPGIKTGLRDIDSKLGGMHNSDLIVIGARPAMGKTAFLLNLANNCGAPCGVISSEQGHEQVGQRLIAINGNVSAHRMRLGRVGESDWQNMAQVIELMTNRAMWIYDRPSPTIDEIARQARAWYFKHEIKILFVDYLQRIRTVGNMTRRESIGSICLSLKELARELDIPVVALSQVNRDVEKRDNKRPYMSDLKEAGEIEQEADQIAMLYRDEVYHPETFDKGIAEINFVKNRHGPLGLIKTAWRSEFMRFENLDNEQLEMIG